MRRGRLLDRVAACRRSRAAPSPAPTGRSWPSPWTKLTLTAAWSRPAPDWWPLSVIVTGIVADEPPEPPPCPRRRRSSRRRCCPSCARALGDRADRGDLARRPVLPSGISTVTCSPTIASLCEARVEVDGHDQLGRGRLQDRRRRPAAATAAADRRNRPSLRAGVRRVRC